MKTIVNFTKVTRIGVMQWPRVLVCLISSASRC